MKTEEPASKTDVIASFVTLLLIGILCFAILNVGITAHLHRIETKLGIQEP